MPPETFLDELRVRLNNDAVPDLELLGYIKQAQRSVKPTNYTTDDYIEQVLDTALQELAIDNKFPEVQSVNVGGLSASYASNDPERYRRRIRARRQASIMQKFSRNLISC